MDVTVTVKKAFPYRGRDRQPGDLVQMEQADAELAQRYGLVGITPKQTYRTRELVSDRG